MEHSFVWWAKKLSMDKDTQYLLERLAWMIDQNNKGKFEVRKALFKEKGVDYRLFHRLPEALMVVQ